jgi:hypothetical protein
MKSIRQLHLGRKNDVDKQKTFEADGIIKDNGIEVRKQTDR